MGRLIDGTIQALPMSNYILERKETFARVLENGDNDFLFAMLMEYFDKQPTAYDKDKVVEVVREDCYAMGFDESQTEIIVKNIRKGGVE